MIKSTERLSINNIDWKLETESDSWISIYRWHDERGWIPCLQARDRGHALAYMTMIEPVTVPLNHLLTY